MSAVNYTGAFPPSAHELMPAVYLEFVARKIVRVRKLYASLMKTLNASELASSAA